MRARKGRVDFAKLVRSAAEEPGGLPLTHMTDAYRFRAVVEEGQLATSPCSVFNEPLLYLFYGRPAYRVAAQIEGTGQDAYWPICFVLKPGIAGAKRTYPFDSGAFHHGRFADYCHRDMIKEDFQLDADPSSPGRVIGLFWDGARDYFDNIGFSDFVPDPLAFEAKSYFEMIRSNSNAPFDERHSTIELQFDQPIALKGNLLAVILPQCFATDEIVRHFGAMDVLVLPFDTVNRHTAANMVGQIYDIARDLYGGEHGKIQCW